MAPSASLPVTWFAAAAPRESGHLLAITGGAVLALLAVAAIVVGTLHLVLFLRRRAADVPIDLRDLTGQVDAARSSGRASLSWRTEPAPPSTAASAPDADTTTATGDHRWASTRREISTSTGGTIQGASVE